MAILQALLKLDYLSPAPTSNQYTYDNLYEWLDNIHDVNIREDIEYWDRKVKRGTMSIEEFDQQLKELTVKNLN